jgi:hypothetical protein
MPHRDDLVAALHARDVCYLAPTPHGDERTLTDDELILGLAQTKDARLRFALAALLLIHPELAERMAHLAENETRPGVQAELYKHYLAAMYLQRMWRTRLRMAFGETALIPERFTHELNLPTAEAMNGELGLHRLTENSLFNDWSSYEQVIELICEQPCATNDVIAIRD